MKAKLIIEGKEFEIEVSNDVLEAFKIKRTGYERVAQGQKYYYVDCEDVVDCVTEDNLESDEASHDCANYYSDEILAENNARADRLKRQLRRFAVEHNKLKTSRHTVHGFGGWVIRYEGGLQTVLIHSNYFDNIYFDSEKIAVLAIETFKSELEWYFTEYKDSL